MRNKAIINKMRKTYVHGSNGQILLIVVVVMVVALTIGLSVASRTITNLKLSRQNEEAQKAFQAASAGIDLYINQTTGGTRPITSSGQVTATVTTLQGATIALNNGEMVDQDRGIDLWLSGYPTFSSTIYTNGTNNVTIYWGVGGINGQTNCNQGAGSNATPALEVLVLREPRSNPVLEKYLYDYCDTRRGGNGFTYPGALYNTTVSGIPDTIFRHRVTISVTQGLIAKIIPIYNSTKIAVSGPAAFPSQGKLIESTGTSGDTKRKIVYYESYPQIPNEIFPYAILSQ